MSCTGNPNVDTPNIDRLADNGVRFANACSTYPVCVPTRFTLMTGEYAHTRSVPHIDWQLSPGEHTIADELNEAGYRTGYIGKWHLAGIHRFALEEDFGYEAKLRKTGYTPVPRTHQGGFDHWQGFELRNRPFDVVYFENDDPAPHELDGFETDGLTDLAIDFLSAAPPEPFFLVLSVTPPHPEFTAPEEYLDRISDRDLELPPNADPAVLEEEGLWEDLRAYYAAIENLDHNLGRLVSRLEAAGLRESTALWFLSDHGEMFGSHGLGLTSGAYPYEESVGVPFVVSYPDGDIDDGRVIEEPTCSEDWYPTIRGLAGLDPDPAKPGVDLTPLMRGDRSTLDREGVFLEWVRTSVPDAHFTGEAWRGFRTERYKYTVRGDAYGCEPWQLFDLRKDPHETQNRIDDPDYRDTATELHGLLRDRMVATEDLAGLRAAFGHDALNAWWDHGDVDS
jgi:arylsulfatase A-like enzyme